MRYFYSFAFLFPNKNVETGCFSLSHDFFEGNTEENSLALINAICDSHDWKAGKVKNYAFRKLSEDFIQEIAHASGYIRGPGNVGS